MDYQAPGVYIEEVNSGNKPISGVGTSTAAFIGKAPAGDARKDQAIMITSWSQFVREFASNGSYLPTGSLLPAAVYGFFFEGGGSCYVARTEESGWIGDEANHTGLHALDKENDFSMVAIPDAASDATSLKTVIQSAVSFCDSRKDCFFLADPPAKTEKPQDYLSNSSYGALYYPWVYVTDPFTRVRSLVPPSGVVAGTYAYTDATRGVHKAPAGTGDGYLDSVLGLEKIVTQGEQNELNQVGVNVIRSLPEGVCIWGARTMSQDTQWRYVNLRRLFVYIERSLEAGTQWVVFEPNDSRLWGQVKRNITAFLTRLWRDGALYGSSPEEAFFVKVDADNNPSSERELGYLNIAVGVAPVKPAEFVIIRVSQKLLG